MRRRTFLASSVAASALTGTAVGGLAAAGDDKRREYYELKVYHLRRGPQVKLTDDFLRQAALPALARLGIGPVGVFNTMIGPESPTVYVLAPYPSLEAVAATAARLDADAEFLKAGAAFLEAPASEPAFLRLDVSLLVAFEGMPRLEVPAAAVAHQPRIFELRTYESHSAKAHKKKIEMFNTAEIAIFRRTGLVPVFFGGTLAGSNLPNLTYMLTFASMEERDRVWDRFRAEPEWKKLSTTPGFTDVETVSNITNVILSPAPYSEI